MAKPKNANSGNAKSGLIIASTIIASIPANAQPPQNPVTLSHRKFEQSASGKVFLDHVKSNYAISKGSVPSLLSLPNLKRWLDEKKTVIVCITDDEKHYLCTVSLKQKRIQCRAVKENETTLQRGYIWIKPA